MFDINKVSDDVWSFVAIAILAGGDSNLMTEEEAAYNLACWKEEDDEIPEDMTPATLAAVWNHIILRHYPNATYMEV